MSVDIEGQWITTKGSARLQQTGEEISGIMCFDETYTEETDIYAKFKGQSDDNGVITLIVESTKPDVPSFQVQGNFFSAEVNGKSAYTLILTDGTTVIGFTRHG